MTTTTKHETIAEYLDRGGDIAEHPRVPSLVEILYYEIPILGLEEVQVMHRRRLDDYLQNGLGALAPRDPAAVDAGFFTETVEEALDRIVRDLTWEVEVIEDPALAQRVRDALEASATSAGWVAEEVRNLNERVDHDRRPFDITLADRGSYRCGFTGAECQGLAVVVTGRGWFADETYEVADRLVFSPEALATWLESACADWRASSPQ